MSALFEKKNGYTEYPRFLKKADKRIVIGPVRQPWTDAVKDGENCLTTRDANPSFID